MKNKTIIKSLLFAMMMYFVMSFSFVSFAETTVYITATGKKYHSAQTCKGLNNARAIYPCTLSEAENKGLSPCTICYGTSSVEIGEYIVDDEEAVLVHPVFSDVISEWTDSTTQWNTVENADYYKVKIYVYYDSADSNKYYMVTDKSVSNTYDISQKVKECLVSNGIYGKVDAIKAAVVVIAVNDNYALESKESDVSEDWNHTHVFAENNTCQLCGKHIHVYSEDNTVITKAPTCLEGGIKTYTCLYCPESYKEPLRLLGHDYEITKNKKATIFENGCFEMTCRRCGDVVSKSIPKLNSKVTLNKKSIKLKTGTKQKIKIKKKTNGDKLSKWTSANKRVATVSEKGVVTGKSKGKTTIKVTMKSGCTSKCKVTVK